MADIFGLLVTLLLLALAFGILWWGITAVMKEFPPPDPIARLVRVVFVILVVLFAIGFIFGAIPVPRYPWR